MKILQEKAVEAIKQNKEERGKTPSQMSMTSAGRWALSVSAPLHVPFSRLRSRGRPGLPNVIISYTFCSPGALGPVSTLIEGIGREGCVFRVCARAEGGRPLCVNASYSRGNACLCFYQCDMRNLAVRTCNVVATPDYSRP
jgi:hypothetical protein